jgi:hypothetical protein
VIARNPLASPNQLANRAARNASFGAPHYAGVASPAQAPDRIKCLKIGPIVGDDNSSLVSGKAELLGVGDASVRAPKLVDGDGIDAALAESVGDVVTDIFIE